MVCLKVLGISWDDKFLDILRIIVIFLGNPVEAVRMVLSQFWRRLPLASSLTSVKQSIEHHCQMLLSIVNHHAASLSTVLSHWFQHLSEQELPRHQRSISCFACRMVLLSCQGIAREDLSNSQFMSSNHWYPNDDLSLVILKHVCTQKFQLRRSLEDVVHRWF